MPTFKSYKKLKRIIQDEEIRYNQKLVSTKRKCTRERINECKIISLFFLLLIYLNITTSIHNKSSKELGDFSTLVSEVSDSNLTKNGSEKMRVFYYKAPAPLWTGRVLFDGGHRSVKKCLM